MAKWKSNDKKNFSAMFLKFEEGQQKNLTVSDWDFTKGAGGYLFKCYVIKENGMETDKIWTVWDFESAKKLKKILGTKHVVGSKDLIVTMRKDDEDDVYFDIK